MKTKIILSRILKPHIDNTFFWMQDAQLRKYFLVRGNVVPEKHTAYFEKSLADPTQRMFAILEGAKHVGNCGLKNILKKERLAELWIYIGPKNKRNRGIGKVATRLLLKKAFGALKLKKVIVHVANFNAAAIRLYENLGFKETPSKGVPLEWQNRKCKIIRMERSPEGRCT